MPECVILALVVEPETDLWAHCQTLGLELNEIIQEVVISDV